jgi:hypothetical protein
MAYSNTVFRQLVNLIPSRPFHSEVERTGANRYTKHFTAWNQLIVNLYAQASSKKSLRDVETGLKVQSWAWYHLGLKNISRSQLSYVNARRDYRLFQSLYYHLFAHCVDLAPKHRFKFNNPLHVLDSTLVHLCLDVFPWAKYRKRKGALKIHTLLDLQGTIPSFIVVTDGRQHDLKVAKQVDLPLSPDSILVVDKAYIDFTWLYGLHLRKVFFVTRAFDNCSYKVIGQHGPADGKMVLNDQSILLRGSKSYRRYPHRLRLITYFDEITDKTLTFMTNNFQLSAKTIAQIYKARWDIELFFKWIKQNLKIKTFLGTSPNAVLVQIWTALIYYLLLAFIKFQTKYQFTLLHFTRVLKEALFQKVDIIALLKLSPNRFKLPHEPDGQMVLLEI